MKTHSIKYFFAALLFLGSLNVSGQASLNAFGGPMLQFSSFDGDPVTQLGAGAALLINRQFFVGGYAMAKTNEFTRSFIDSTSNPPLSIGARINFSQFGAWLGYIVNPDNKVQLSVNSYAGFGVVTAEDDMDQSRRDRIYLFGPYVGVAYAATDWMRVEANGGYRAMGKVNDTGVFTDQDLSALFGGITLKFGGFD
jgi:hypothetical protein